MNLAIIPNIGPIELLIIFFIIVLFFGANRLPALFGSLGKSLKEFKKASSEEEKPAETGQESSKTKETEGSNH